MRFSDFLFNCAKLASFRALERHFEPSVQHSLDWIDSTQQAKLVYNLLEEDILRVSLRWKTNQVTIASFLHQLFCTYRLSLGDVDGFKDANIDRCF